MICYVKNLCAPIVSKMIKIVLIDLSGTLHVENEAIPGAAEALKR